ncbi:MAG TPA: tripartite tricarboxylate transporter substrate binding protein [Xanthobacteraceae bacterium]|nr:tripartite tricarboxylate transporter substrate binding protein [Xanthobacteraceae bacterium]
MKWLAVGVGAACMAFVNCAGPVRAQEWPSKPVRVIAPFAAGGAADRLGRIIAAGLAKSFNKPFFIDNRPGGNGIVGSARAALAEPDGYTLLIAGSGPHLTSPAVDPNIVYDPLHDFTHIAMIGGDTFVLVASPALGVKSLADLIALGKRSGKPISYGAPGNASPPTFIMEQFKRRAGIDLVQVPYRGGGNAAMDIVDNYVSTALLPFLTIGNAVRGGTVVPLAVTSAERNPAFKDIPTFAELGYPDVRGYTWFWLSGPKNLPYDIVQKLNREVRRILKSPEVKAQFEKQALLTMDLDVPALNKLLADEVAQWAAIAKQSGVRVQ